MTINIYGQEYSNADIPVEAARDALAVQGACNLSGVAISLGQHMKTICDLPTNKGTDWKNHHPVVVLFMVQLAHLSTRDVVGVEGYSACVALCEEVIREAKA